MKKIKLYTLATLVLLLTIITSCKKKFFYEGINQDPTALNTPEPSVLLPAAEANLAYFYGGDLGRFSGVITQQMKGSGNQWVSIGQLYNISDDETDNCWNSLYTTTLNSLTKMTAYAESKGSKHYAGIGKVLTAYTMIAITDMWGAAPYSEAFKGAANLQPTYDAQDQIYTSMFALIDAGLVDLAVPDPKAGTLPGADDFIYGGDADRWTKFAHLLKAKMYLHLVKVDNGNVAKGLAELPMAFADASDDGKFASFDGANGNPIFQFGNERTGDITYVGSFLFDSMAAISDPRLPLYVDTTGGGDVIGSAFGSPTSPVFFLSYMEQKFIEAELQQRNTNAPAALLAYNEAVTESFAMTGATGAAAYLVAHPATGLESIMTQKYFAMFTNPESWVDVRRTSFPALTPIAPGATSIPRRLTYPQSETLNNKNSIPPNQTVFTRVWWDK